MASIIRRKQNTILEQVLKEGDRFNFFQCIRILEEGLHEFKFPRIEPHDSLGFPASDMQTCQDSQDQLEIKANFLGLFGVSSPLPHHFITEMTDNDESGFIKAFLSIFNQVFYETLYASWRHTRTQDPVEAMPAFSHYFHANADVLSQKTVTLLGVQALAKRYFPHQKVSVSIQRSGWKPMIKPSRLGLKQDRLKLSDNVILGRRVLSACANIEIMIQGATPASQDLKGFQSALNQYISQHAAMTIYYELPPQPQKKRLGKDTIALNANTFLGTTCRAVTKRWKHVE